MRHTPYCDVILSERQSKLKNLMEPEKLPWELEENILSRVPPLSLVRFKTVCKRWPALFNDKRFINNHLAQSRSQFILWADSEVYSVCINNLDGNDPSIEMCKLVLDCPDPNFMLPKNMAYCYGFLLCVTKKGVALWNPWLRQTRWLEYEKEKDVHRQFLGYGIGYDINSSGYKILKYDVDWYANPVSFRVKIYEIASNTWKVVRFNNIFDEFRGIENFNDSVSMNGSLYGLLLLTSILVGIPSKASLLLRRDLRPYVTYRVKMFEKILESSHFSREIGFQY